MQNLRSFVFLEYIIKFFYTGIRIKYSEEKTLEVFFSDKSLIENLNNIKILDIPYALYQKIDFSESNSAA